MPPKCRRIPRIEAVATVSGSPRTPSETDQAGLVQRLARNCGDLGMEGSGKLTFAFSADADGTISELKTIENSLGSAELELLMRREVEKIVTFPSSDPSRVTITFVLE